MAFSKKPKSIGKRISTVKKKAAPKKKKATVKKAARRITYRVILTPEIIYSPNNSARVSLTDVMKAIIRLRVVNSDISKISPQKISAITKTNLNAKAKRK